MLQALLRGKLSREQENMEDILTSSVFGLFGYLPPQDGLFPFLARAQALDGSFPLKGLSDREYTVDAAADYLFWPYWTEPGCAACEPDLVIKINGLANRQLMILIEAKYLRGKSSEANPDSEVPEDQLACEWHNLVHVARREKRRPYLVYLTNDLATPKSEIEKSIRDFFSATLEQDRKPDILALSWRQVHEICRDSSLPILKDLFALARRLGLVYFDGFHPLRCRRLAWRFNPLPARWTRISEPREIRWRFAQ
jgi:hypothetical protein